MPTQCIGKEINEGLLKKLNEQLEKFVTKNKISEDTIKDTTQVFKTIFKDKDGKDIYLLTDEPGKAPKEYELLSELINYISFEKTPSDEVYEIPEVIVRDPENKEHKETHKIYLTKKNAKSIAEKEKEFRNTLGIEFPDELFQLYHDNVIPNITDYTAPLPKRYSETEEEYEERLEAEYKEHGVEKEKLGEYRYPYPHEMVRYNKPIPEMTQTGRTSFQKHLSERTLPSEFAEPGNTGSREGEQQEVTGTNKPLAQRLWDLAKSVKGVAASKGTVKTVLATAASGIMVGGSLISFPIATLSVIGTTGAMLGIAYVGKKYGVPALKAIKKKLVDSLKGREIKEPEEPEHTTSPETTPAIKTEPTRKEPTRVETPSPRVSPEPEPEPLEIPEDLADVLIAIEAEAPDIKKINSQIEVAKANLEIADESTKAMWEQRLIELQAQKRQILVNVYNLLQDYINNKTNKIGGPSL